MIASPILPELTHAAQVAQRAARIALRASKIAARAARVAEVEVELAQLVADGVKIAVKAAYVVSLEEKGLVVNLETGEIVEPVVALDRVRAAL